MELLLVKYGSNVNNNNVSSYFQKNFKKIGLSKDDSIILSSTKAKKLADTLRKNLRLKMKKVKWLSYSNTNGNGKHGYETIEQLARFFATQQIQKKIRKAIIVSGEREIKDILQMYWRIFFPKREGFSVIKKNGYIYSIKTENYTKTGQRIENIFF